MIQGKNDLKEYLDRDAKANARSSIKARLLGDEAWKYIRILRYLEYSANCHKVLSYGYYKLLHHKMGIRLGVEIPINVFDKGLSLPHPFGIVVSKFAKVGENCRVHEGVTIGATNGEVCAATIGNNVFLGSGAKIIGNITIADDVAVGAGAVVVKNIGEKGTTWGGVPAKLISHNDSRANMPTDF